jgi:hypothetical protein
MLPDGRARVFSPNIDALQVGQRLHARAESASKTRVNALTTCASIDRLAKMDGLLAQARQRSPLV